MRTDQGELLFKWSQPPGKGFFVGESTGEEFVCELRAWLPGKPCPMCQPYEKKLEYKTRIQNSNTKLDPPKKSKTPAAEFETSGSENEKVPKKLAIFVTKTKLSSETSRPPEILSD
jgi:hypothetical protein